VELINDQRCRRRSCSVARGWTHYANYNEWTDFFIKYWGEELSKRGVAVGPQSPNKINVKLYDFMFIQGFAVVRTNARIISPRLTTRGKGFRGDGHSGGPWVERSGAWCTTRGEAAVDPMSWKDEAVTGWKRNALS